MSNSISGRNDFYSRYGGVESIYGRNASVQSAGLSAKSLDAINQLSGIGSVSSANLRLNNLNSLNSLSKDFLQKRTASTTVTLSTPAKLQSSLSSFNQELKNLASASQRNPLQANSSDNNIVKAKAITTGDPVAEKSVNIQQLAQGQLSLSANFASRDELVGQERLSIELGAIKDGLQVRQGVVVSVELAATDTVVDVARKIQSAQPALKASVISDAEGTRLQLESVATGANQAFTVQAQTLAGDVASGNLARLAVTASAAQSAARVAQDALLQIDGRDIRSASNSVNDQSSNLSLDLLQSGRADVSLVRDVQILSKNLNQFVEQYNQTRSQLNALNAVGGRSQDSGTGLARNEIARLDQLINNLSVGVGLDRVSLNDLGMTTTNDGRLIVNETRLSQQALAMPDAVNRLFNRAVDQFSESSTSSLQALSQFTNPYQLMARKSETNSVNVAASSGNSFSLLQPGGAGIRAWYGISQYLMVSQFG